MSHLKKAALCSGPSKGDMPPEELHLAEDDWGAYRWLRRALRDRLDLLSSKMLLAIFCLGLGMHLWLRMSGSEDLNARV